MSWLWQGIVLGLTLSVLAGPMMFLFLQLGVERGFRAGTAAAAGAWTSDIVYMLGSYFGVSYLLKLTQWNGFQLYMGLIGGAILIATGLSIIFSRQTPQGKVVQPSTGPGAGNSYLALYLKGFLINTFNPFAAFFWLSVVSAASATGNLTGPAVTGLFSGIIGTIVLTDMLKVFLAKRIKPWLSQHKLFLFRRISGIALIAFGVVLVMRVIAGYYLP